MPNKKRPRMVRITPTPNTAVLGGFIPIAVGSILMRIYFTVELKLGGPEMTEDKPAESSLEDRVKLLEDRTLRIAKELVRLVKMLKSLQLRSRTR